MSDKPKRKVVFKKTKTVKNSKKIIPVAKSYTKTEILSGIATGVELPKKKIAQIFEHLQEIINAHVKKGISFSIPGLLKINVVNRPATKARKGVNPFTGEPTVFKAKPARKVVKVKALKKLKAMA